MTTNITIDDFLVKPKLRIGFPFTREFNYKKIFELTDDQFSELYLLMMEEYRDKDNYWKNGSPQCWRCNNSIETPKDMRKLFGRTLHGNCFKKDYDEVYKNHNLDSNTRTFFEKVYAINHKE